MNSNWKNELKALSALEWKRTCMVIRAVVYSGWTSTPQTRAGSKTSVMAGKIQFSARMSEHTQHTARQEDDCSVNIHTHTAHSPLNTYCYGHTYCTHTRMIPLPPSPECRVFPQPPVWAPGVQSYALPIFPGPGRSTGADPDPINATPRPGTDAGGHPDLDTIGHTLRI